MKILATVMAISMSTMSMLACTQTAPEKSDKRDKPMAPAAPNMTSVKLTKADGALPDLLAREAGKAKAAGLRPFVELWATWCPPCIEIEKGMRDPRMQAAFAGVYLIRLDIDHWGTTPSGSTLDGSSIPAFYQLDADGSVVPDRRIDGGAWGDNTIANMAPPLTGFFQQRRS